MSTVRQASWLAPFSLPMLDPRPALYLQELPSTACTYADAQVRPSMTKYACEHGPIAVLRLAAFTPGFLNRQIILLLNHLGVEVG